MSQHTITLAIDQPDWLSIIDVVFTSTAAAIWVLIPQIGFWPLFLVAIPWVLRFRQTGHLAVVNPLTLPILIFMFTAVVGIWSAYNSSAAWAKFWLLVASFFLFYTLANLPTTQLWFVAKLLSILSIFVGAYFLLTHDWLVNPIHIGILDRLADKWMGVRPFLNSPSFHPNQAAGLIVVLLPFSIAVVIHEFREWAVGFRIIMGVGIAVLFFALLLTGSRGAWFALIGALALWAWSFISHRLVMYIGGRQLVIFWCGIVVALAVGIIIMLLIPGNLIDLADLLPGVASAESRAAILRNTQFLIGDFPFSGGGLDSFAGLYSQYILVIPQKIYTYAHNFYLDVALEQGILGLAGAAGMLLGTIWLLGRSSNSQENFKGFSLLWWAVAAGLVVMILRGMVDDAFYGNRATPLIWVLPGFTVALTRGKFKGGSRLTLRQRGVVLLVLILVFAGILLQRQGRAAWFANIGAVKMASVELVDWPTNKWDDGRTVPELQPAKQLFNKALEIYPANRTAHHRLGMIAMLEREYETAVGHLELAYEIDGDHIGVRKSLAYSYIWNGQLVKAQILLADIPEAQNELENYVFWWRAQERDDLAAQAERMLIQLTENDLPGFS